MSINRAYALIVLLAVNFGSCQAGRFLLGLLTEPVKRDLLLSDSQIGALTGISLGIAYSLFLLPSAWVADRYNRRLFLGIFGLGYVAGAVLSATATDFFQLFCARTLVAASEASLFSVSVSLIGDLLPAKKRPMGFALFTAGVVFMISCTFMLAGWLEGAFGWRGVFGWFAAAHAVILTGVILLVREPGRNLEKGSPPLMAVVRTLVRKPSFLLLVVLACLYVFAYTAALTWVPSFLIRTRDFTQAAASNFIGLSIGVVAGVVIAVGGMILNRARQASVSGPLIVATWLSVALVLVYGIGLSLPGALALACLAAGLAAAPIVNSVLMSSVQELAQPAYRATAIALVLIPDAVIGGGAGAFVTGFLSDLGSARFGSQSIQYALLCVVGSSWVVAALLYWATSKYIGRDVLPEPGEELPPSHAAAVVAESSS